MQLEKTKGISDRSPKYKHYLIRIIKHEPIKITGDAYAEVMQAFVEGDKYIMVGETLIMVNAISMIEPVVAYPKGMGNMEFLAEEKLEGRQLKNKEAMHDMREQLRKKQP